MNKNKSLYIDYITRGPVVMVDGKPFRRKVGAVVCLVNDNTLSIGWSLCNFKEGDRFSNEHAISLAQGRALTPRKTNLKFSIKEVPTMRELIMMGVPQSSLSVMKDLIVKAMKQNKDITTITIFNNKTAKSEPTPQYMW